MGEGVICAPRAIHRKVPLVLLDVPYTTFSSIRVLAAFTITKGEQGPFRPMKLFENKRKYTERKKLKQGQQELSFFTSLTYKWLS